MVPVINSGDYKLSDLYSDNKLSFPKNENTKIT